jgi:hypothetical protein
LEVLLSRRFALTADVGHSRGAFGTASVGSETVMRDARIGFDASRIGFGVLWFPLAGR